MKSHLFILRLVPHFVLHRGFVSINTFIKFFVSCWPINISSETKINKAALQLKKQKSILDKKKHTAAYVSDVRKTLMSIKKKIKNTKMHVSSSSSSLYIITSLNIQKKQQLLSSYMSTYLFFIRCKSI